MFVCTQLIEFKIYFIFIITFLLLIIDRFSCSHCFAHIRAYLYFFIYNQSFSKYLIIMQIREKIICLCSARIIRGASLTVSPTTFVPLHNNVASQCQKSPHAV